MEMYKASTIHTLASNSYLSYMMYIYQSARKLSHLFRDENLRAIACGSSFNAKSYSFDVSRFSNRTCQLRFKSTAMWIVLAFLNFTVVQNSLGPCSYSMWPGYLGRDIMRRGYHFGSLEMWCAASVRHVWRTQGILVKSAQWLYEAGLFASCELSAPNLAPFFHVRDYAWYWCESLQRFFGTATSHEPQLLGRFSMQTNGAYTARRSQVSGSRTCAMGWRTGIVII